MTSCNWSGSAFSRSGTSPKFTSIETPFFRYRRTSSRAASTMEQVRVDRVDLSAPREAREAPNDVRGPTSFGVDLLEFLVDAGVLRPASRGVREEGDARDRRIHLGGDEPCELHERRQPLGLP